MAAIFKSEEIQWKSIKSQWKLSHPMNIYTILMEIMWNLMKIIQIPMEIKWNPMKITEIQLEIKRNVSLKMKLWAFSSGLGSCLEKLPKLQWNTLEALSLLEWPRELSGEAVWRSSKWSFEPSRVASGAVWRSFLSNKL